MPALVEILPGTGNKPELTAIKPQTGGSLGTKMVAFPLKTDQGC